MRSDFSDKLTLEWRFRTAILIVIGLLLSAADPAMAQVSRPGAYSGYSTMIYSETVRSSQYVPMRDAFIFRANVNGARKISVGPHGHCGFGNFDLLAEERRWFDYWLKDIRNGIVEEPPIYLNTIHAQADRAWRFSWQWPLLNAKRMVYYLGRGPSGSR